MIRLPLAECDEVLHTQLRDEPVTMLAVGLAPTNGRRWLDGSRVACCPLCTTFLMSAPLAPDEEE